MELFCRMVVQSQEKIYVQHLVAGGRETVHRSTKPGVQSWHNYFSRKRVRSYNAFNDLFDIPHQVLPNCALKTKKET